MDGSTARSVLGLAPGATRGEIKQAFRALAKAAHPDALGSTEAFVALHAAYKVALREATIDEPVVVTVPSSPTGPAARRWFSGAAPASASRIDLSDTRGFARPAAAPSAESDQLGRTFAEILDAELARA